MKTLLCIAQFFLISLLSIFHITDSTPAPASSNRCLEDQKPLLLGLKSGLIFNPEYSTKLAQWNHTNKDCCTWNGVECDVQGHVISLQLDGDGISGGLDDLDQLFDLRYLQKLNLAFNNFGGIQIPARLYNLTNLTHLNLSRTGFGGQVPGELSRMTNLVSLDLSSSFGGGEPLKLENPNLKMLVQNLTELKELYLDYVNITSGQLESLANFPNLTTLSLAHCRLVGTFPEKIFQLSTLEKLDLSYNSLLSGNLPEFRRGGSLSSIVLRYTNFSGSLPDSISNLAMLSRLELSGCNFTGQIPSTLGSLKKLAYLNAYHNSLSGSLSPLHFEGLSSLVYVNLGHNLLSGTIPPSLFDPTSLQELQLSNNKFEGQVQVFSNPSSSSLEIIDLSSNRLEGPIPKFFFQIERLKQLSLSSNNFNGTIHLEMFKSLNISRIELSYNDLSIDTNSSWLSLSSIHVLKLASCKLQNFPMQLRHMRIAILDLSANQLRGQIPNWLWEIGNGSLYDLNLAFNQLHGFQKPYKFPSLLALDLHSNQFHGELPMPPSSSSYVDYSFNYFNNSIPDNIGNFISFATFFSASNNNLTGGIPTSICNATDLKVLDLSENALTGSIPPCLPKENWFLLVLNLGRNNLSGEIPDTFPVDCRMNTLNLNKNVLSGSVPGSLINCSSLEVLNIGNNRIEDTFPCMLIETSLHVLILRSNGFYGDLQCLGDAIQGWTNLQIIDISNNNFSGDISLLPFSSWRGMINVDQQSQYNFLRFDFISSINLYSYQDAVTVTMKGVEMEITKILNIFISIDFSRNNFHGNIPYTLGDLKSLYLLNLSHNGLTGAIPTSIGNLTQLGSLDLSANHLTGKIPTELTDLTFLSFLNLSFNDLFGMIPKGSQLQTFSTASYEGNDGLCGFPVNVSCNDEENDVSSSSQNEGLLHGKEEIEGVYVSASLGFVVGLGGFLWLLWLCKKWRIVYFEKVDQILSKVVPVKGGRKRSGGRRVNQCLQGQKQLLLELRNNLTYDSSLSTKLVYWNEFINYCQWRGVKCDSKSRVSGLDLSSEAISGGVNTSSLFKLVYLQSLNLAYNVLNYVQFPSGFGQLTDLHYMNLCYSGFSGEVPMDLSNLARLVVLDLSYQYSPPSLENLERLIHSFTRLRELYLDGVNISAKGY